MLGIGNRFPDIVIFSRFYFDRYTRRQPSSTDMIMKKQKALSFLLMSASVRRMVKWIKRTHEIDEILSLYAGSRGRGTCKG